MEQLSEFVSNHWILSSAFAVLLFMLVTNILGGVTAGGSQVTPQQAVGLINHEDALVVDLREQADFDRGHILDAMHVPLRSLRDKLQELERYKDKAIILCCQSGNTSTQASGILAKAGYSKLYRLGGGIISWQNDNMPLARE